MSQKVRRRIGALVRGYRTGALILVNTLVLVVLLEGLAWLILIWQSETRYRNTPLFYASREWSSTLFREQSVAGQMKYQPYVVWRRRPFEGETINVDENGIRRTPGASDAADAYRVFCFGGSTVWGTAAPDWGTIPAYLQRELAELRSEPVSVVNLGEGGYVSTQELVRFVLQLRQGDVPDLALFYDGINDVYTSYQSGRTRVHQNIWSVEEGFERRWAIAEAMGLLKRSHILRLLAQATRPNAPRTYKTRGVEAEDLAQRVVEEYLENYDLVEALSRAYGFRFAFFFQPALCYGDKPFTREEEQLANQVDADLHELCKAVYERIDEAAERLPHLHLVADVFKDTQSQLYTDLMHITPEGNEIVARRLVDILRTNGPDGELETP